MATNTIYKRNEDGTLDIISEETVPDIADQSSGVVDLVGGRATVQSIHAGKKIGLSRQQDNTTAVGSLYIYEPQTVAGVSFQIRSSNVNDAGTVVWYLIDEI